MSDEHRRHYTSESSDQSTLSQNNVLSAITKWIDSNIGLIKYSVYCVGVVGIIMIGRSIRVHQKFCNIRDIPDKFLHHHTTLRGYVHRVAAPDILRVEHIPIITSKWVRYFDRYPKGLLSVRVAGVEMTDAGFAWLQGNVSEREVKFKPLELSTTKLQLDCIVTFRQHFYKKICVNDELIKMGLCKVDPLLHLTDHYVQLMDRLIRLEIRADKKQRGLWAELDSQKKKPSILSKLWKWIRRKKDVDKT